MLKLIYSRSPFIWIFSFFLCAFISVYIRLYPWRVALTSESHEKASMLVVYKITQDFLNHILQTNPSIKREDAQKLAMQQLNQLMHEHPQRVMAAIDSASQNIAQNATQKEPNYLLESDPFYYYQLTENIAQKGRIAPTIKGSKYVNPLMNAPDGSLQPFTLHPYCGFYFYQLLKIYNPSIALMSAAGFLPVVLSCCGIGLFLIFCYILRLTPLSSLAGCFIFSLAPIFLKRSAMGWYDTDPYNMFFTLLLFGLITLGLRQGNSRHATSYGMAYGATMTLFALIWQGWVMMFFVGIGCTLTLLIIMTLQGQWKKWINPCMCFTASSSLTAAVLISSCFGAKDFFALFQEGFGELGKFTVNGIDLWPNLFIAVGELKRSSLKDFIQSLGGIIILVVGIGSSLWIFFDSLFRRPSLHSTQRHVDIILLSTLLGATTYLSLGAERFILFLPIPFSLLIAYALNDLAHFRWLHVLGCAALIIFTTLHANHIIPTTVSPIFNPTWDKALTRIKETTPPDAIINTWWPPGHFIKAISNRSVIFDGATLSEGAIGFWIARALLATDEAKAQGIIRMINSSRNRAVDYLTRQGLKTSQAVALIEQIVSLGDHEITETLKPHFNPEQISMLRSFLRGSSLHSYLLLYNEIMDQNIILSFTGNWDIRKIEAINASPSLLANIPKRNTPAFVDFCWKIAGGQTRTSPPLNLISENNQEFVFNDGLVIDKLTMEASINSPVYGQGQPISVVYQDNHHIIERLNPSANLNYSVIIYQQGDGYAARLMDQPLANSLLVKLYYFKGEGLMYFKPLDSFNDLSNRTVIKTFQITWKD